VDYPAHAAGSALLDDRFFLKAPYNRDVVIDYAPGRHPPTPVWSVPLDRPVCGYAVSAMTSIARRKSDTLIIGAVAGWCGLCNWRKRKRVAVVPAGPDPLTPLRRRRAG
jgi:hypothetical protein